MEEDGGRKYRWILRIDEGHLTDDRLENDHILLSERKKSILRSNVYLKRFENESNIHEILMKCRFISYLPIRRKNS